MRVYFISDLHLKFQEDREDCERRIRVTSFLKSITGKADLLVLNGDIFDLWFDWQDVIIKGYFPFLKVLADLNESGCRLILIAGNHDFWFNGFLEEYLDMEIYHNEFTTTIDKQRIYVTHGDLHTSNDMRYKLFRSIIRNSLIKFIFRILHPDLALNLGKLLSRSSRERKLPAQLKQKKEQGLIRFAAKKLKNYDMVIMGHAHAPRIDELNQGKYVNLGDWIVHNTYLEMVDGKIDLKEYKIKEL